MPSKLAWKPPSNPKSQLIPGNLHDIAEPVHRIGPQGVSSGVSLREFPLSCTQEIQNICLHYVHKCMGKYEDNKVASRYVYQMSDEILKLLSGALEELKWREDRPIIYQNLLDEWNKCFPESLGIQGSPKFISSKLIKQSKEIEDLKAKVDYLTKSKTTEIEGMKKSVDTQMHSIRQATLQDRKAMESSFKQQEISYSEDLSKLHNYIEVLHDQILELQKEQDNTRQDQLKELENHKSYVDTMNREIANIHENYHQLIKDEKNVQHDLKIQIKSLEESLESEKQKIQSVINAKESTNELYDIISKIEDIATTECDDGKGSDLMTNDLSNRSKSKLNSFKMSTVVDAYIDDINKLKRVSLCNKMKFLLILKQNSKLMIYNLIMDVKSQRLIH